MTVEWSRGAVFIPPPLGKSHATPMTVLYCTVLYCTALHCTVLYCTVLQCTVVYCTVLYCTVLYCTVLYCTVLYCTVLYCTVLNCTVLYCTVLYCTVLYCTVLYCAVLYCTVLYCGAPIDYATIFREEPLNSSQEQWDRVIHPGQTLNCSLHSVHCTVYSTLSSLYCTVFCTQQLSLSYIKLHSAVCSNCVKLLVKCTLWCGTVRHGAVRYGTVGTARYGARWSLSVLLHIVQL